MKHFYILVASLVSAISFAQNGVITGKVVDGENNFSLPGATIKIENSNRYTISDQNGGYEFLSLPEGTYNVYVEYLGYITASQEVIISSDQKYSS
ncbi:TonB-linked outer membrane protein, SusC/RagA family [Weeksella virosa]|nr:TonB-linked outer membrane protein, SusC/RagA family [Weeksella virosa]